MSGRARNRKRPPQHAEQCRRYGCYCRVSTEDQALAETIKAQIEYLRARTQLDGLPVFEFYVDDGISGTIPLEDRPEGRRLLEDARAGAFQGVLVYRLDRLGRTLKTLISAHEQLDACGVSIKSMTEPFDTTSAFGRAMFQFLGVMAELEKATMAERCTGGRDRVARKGQYTGGPIPFGYDLDAERMYVPSERVVESVGLTEAEVCRQMFSRIAFEGSTLYAERARLSALGVPCGKRYPVARRKSKAKTRPDATGSAGVIRTEWAISTVDQILHSPLYKGAATIDSVNGTVERPGAGLVPAEVWDLVQVRLATNRKMSSRNSKRDYLLRGLPTCGACGRTYTGAEYRGRAIYRCLGRRTGEPGAAERPCSGGQVAADELEAAVWDAVKAFAEHPDEHLTEARRRLREQLADASGHEEERRGLVRSLASLAEQKDRVLDAYRRGWSTPEKCQTDLDEINDEKGRIQALLDSMAGRAAMAEASEAYLSDVASAVSAIGERLEEIEADPNQQRTMIATLTSGIVVSAEAIEGARTRAYTVDVTLSFQAPETVCVTGTPGGLNSHAALALVRRLDLRAVPSAPRNPLAVA